MVKLAECVVVVNVSLLDSSSLTYGNLVLEGLMVLGPERHFSALGCIRY